MEQAETRKTKAALLPMALALLLCLAAFPARAERALTDQAGRTIRVPDRPARVVSLAPSITEIVFALGRGASLKGATQFSDYPEEAGALPKVGSYVRLDLEKIIALSPDLCIAVKDGTPIQTVRRLEAMGIPVYAVTPMDLVTVMGAITHLGEVLNAPGAARDLTEGMKARVSRVERLAARAGTRPTVFLQIGISPIVSVGRDTHIHDLIRRAGGRNVAEGQTAYPRYAMEEVLALAPEVLIITSMARTEEFQRVKERWQGWPGLPAAKSGRIHLVNSDFLDRPSPRMVRGLELLLELIHPELAKELGDA